MWVVKLNGGDFLKYTNGYFEGVAISLADLSDFSVANPQPNQVLSWDGNSWSNTTISSDSLVGNLNAVNYVAVNTDSITAHLSAIDDELANVGAGGGALNFSRQNTDFNAVVGTHYSIDTTAEEINVTLPLLSSVSAGDSIRFYLRNRPALNNVVISRNGGGADTINGEASLTLDVQYDTITLIANTTDSLWEVV
jgi:hypothetical protein